MKDLLNQTGELFVCGFAGKEVTEEVKTLIHQHRVGGFILFSRNLGTPVEIKRLTTALQREAQSAGYEYPLLICTDQENGIVRRLGEGATLFPGAMLLGATQNPDNAFKVGLATGKELQALGINWNLAPTVDVNNNPLNPVIGVRSYGENPDQVSQFALQAMQGMQAAGVMTTLKHFPGHGDTQVDSHLECPVIEYPLERLEAVELKPFQTCITAGADTVMTAHIYFSALAEEKGCPATLSKEIITGLLRQQLNFDGVITTDCMEMKAIADTVGTVEGSLLALQAGVDLIMISHSYALQLQAMERLRMALHNGEIDAERIRASIRRIKRLKEQYLRWEQSIDDSFSPVDVSVVVGCAEHRRLAMDVYRQGITIVKGQEQLPLDPSAKMLILYPEQDIQTLVEDKRYDCRVFADEFHQLVPTAEIEQVAYPLAEEKINQLIQRANRFEILIAGTLSVAQSPDQAKLIQKLKKLNKKMIVVAMKSPYDQAYLPDVDVYIATYEYTETALKLTAQALLGLESVSGRLPITLPSNTLFSP
ncbi:beta-N-acetylhexosaminidase [Caldalkalibacillus uzonensis]|uniref:Beta-N-acetylhexosaminidase n=1 Tax=Caldalkalibacillus uzonensis TaxID=353224 RepID=A0ABU0CX07_9BACI|nr:beta-N-acetylhexosaminidase [Caldalkalibacillus uzonensis]MDQ0340874.1 beta-N-acetylhexosaminidase [Caldalkalibacillus uzonensis]